MARETGTNKMVIKH